jgi:hypothetical protein
MTIATIAPPQSILIDLLEHPVENTPLTSSIAHALSAYIYLARDVDYCSVIGLFNNHCEANTLHTIDTSAEDKRQATEMLSYWESKFFMAKLSHKFTLTAWREKLLYMCSNRHGAMTAEYKQLIVTLPRITSYEARTDHIATKYTSHDAISESWRHTEDVVGLELSLIDKYRHDTKAAKSFVYRLVDIENKVYELSISKQRASTSWVDDTISASSAFDALFAISGSVRLAGRTKMMPLNNVTHNKFIYKALNKITSITPIDQIYSN